MWVADVERRSLIKFLGTEAQWQIFRCLVKSKGTFERFVKRQEESLKEESSWCREKGKACFRVKTARSGIETGCKQENLECLERWFQKQEEELFWSVSNRKLAVKRRKAKQLKRDAKRAEIILRERRVSPMDRNEPQHLESADSHSADWKIYIKIS